MFTNKLLNKISNNILIKPLFNHYTAGETIKDLHNKITLLKNQNIYAIGDYIKEFSKDKEETIKQYQDLCLIDELEYVAIKPSSFNFDYNKINYIVSIFLDNNKKILIDAEDSKNHLIINDIIKKLAFTNLDGDNYHIYKTYQMYRRDSLLNLKKEALANNLGIKLVRGAYLNTDRNLPEFFNVKKNTDVAFRNAMNFIIEANIPSFICTHNLEDIKYMIDIKPGKNIKHASLYGFINNETNQIIKSGIKTYKYLPYGKIDDAVPYLLRRLNENPNILKYLLY